MKILILGDMGQLGSALSENLKRDHEVTGWDVKRSMEEDLRCHYPALQSRNADFVVFLAFDVGGAKYLKRYQHTYDFMSNNVRIMDMVFHALKLSGTPFVFTSSQMAGVTHSEYGVLKLMGEKLTRSLGGVTARLWNVYGVEPKNERSHVITDFIHMAREGEIRMLTDGSEQRQFLHVDDFCAAIRCIMERYDEIPHDVHVSSFRWTPISRVAEIVASHYAARVILGDSKDAIQEGVQVEPECNLLPWWKPMISLRSGISQVIQSTP